MFWLIVFAACALAIAYVLAGYPLLLALQARFRARPVLKRFESRSVSIVIAVHNGEMFLRNKLRYVLALRYPRELLQILVVSDGSTDATDAIAAEFASEGVALLRIPRAGKPAALNAGIHQATGEILVLTDVRQELEPESVERLVACFADPAVGVASGELLIRKGGLREEADIGLYWRFESWIRNQLSALDSMFGATGPFYAIRRSVAVTIPEDVLLDDVYLPLSAFFCGFRLIVEPRARAIDYPTTLDTEFRRKVRTLAGNYQIIGHFPALLGPANRMWLHFLSYKVGRLLLPYALIGLAVASFGLSRPWAIAAVAAQAAGYGLAALDPWIPASWILKRLSSPARTFVVMMLAAVCAVQVFFVSPRKLWKPTTIPSLKL
ncbi:MAG: glycosyltransferase family 2 protein [Bryobacteraceae bacterium]